MVALATDPNANMIVSITDSAGNAYEQVSLVVNSGQIRTYLFMALNVNAMASGSTITIDTGVSVTARVAIAALFTGLADSGVLDQTASATGTSTAPSSGVTSTTNQDNELLIGVIGTEGPEGDSTGTWDGSFLDVSRTGTTGDADDTNITIALGYRIVSSTGAYAASKSSIVSRDWGAIIATFGQLNIVDFNILLGRPTDDSTTFNVIPSADVDFKVEYGIESGVYTGETSTYIGEADAPIEFVIDGLAAHTRYYYRIVYYDPGTAVWENDVEHSFITQRALGSAFTFTIISDSHLGQYGGQTADELALYEQTLQNVASDHPDFHLDLGDASAMDPSPLGTGMTEAEARAAYYFQRPYLGEITHSIPFYMIIGNHENEEGWNFDDTFTPPDQSLAIVGLQARKLYFPNPIPDDFYTGNEDLFDTPIGGDGYHEDYWAYEWGDALFVVLDPYHYSMTWPNDEGTSYGGEGQDGEPEGDRWDWSLGIQQYLWLKDTLENSPAKYKFVFAHHVTGGTTQYGRGGKSAVEYFEWGGKNWMDRLAYLCHRPALGGKCAYPLATVGGSPPNHALRTMNGALLTWGYHLAGQTGLKMGSLASTDELAGYQPSANKVADQLFRAVVGQHALNLTFISLMVFKIQQLTWQRELPGSYDYAYWQAEGWLDHGCTFYLPHQANPVKVALARLVGAGISRFVA